MTKEHWDLNWNACVETGYRCAYCDQHVTARSIHIGISLAARKTAAIAEAKANLQAARDARTTGEQAAHVGGEVTKALILPFGWTGVYNDETPGEGWDPGVVGDAEVHERPVLRGPWLQIRHQRGWMEHGEAMRLPGLNRFNGFLDGLRRLP